MAKFGTRKPKDRVTKLRHGFGWLAVLGVLLVLAGVVGLVYTAVATLTSMLLFGWLLLIGGIVGLLHAIQSRGTNFFWLGVIVAALNIGSLVVRGPQFGWTLLLGAFDLLLGILVLASWPSSSQYVIGAFFSLALLFDGLALLATGYSGHRVVGLVSDQH